MTYAFSILCQTHSVYVFDEMVRVLSFTRFALQPSVQDLDKDRIGYVYLLGCIKSMCSLSNAPVCL